MLAASHSWHRLQPRQSLTLYKQTTFDSQTKTTLQLDNELQERMAYLLLIVINGRNVL